MSSRRAWFGRMWRTGAAAAAAVLPGRAAPSQSVAPRADAVAMLYDTTLCIGCQACVTACATVNNLPADTAFSGTWRMAMGLNSHTKNVIKLYKDDDDKSNWSFVKYQCMHCLDPACVGGCPFHALEKNQFGAVTWTGSKCIGCRYCEVACPFGVPQFEFDKFNPKIVKCEFCFHLLEKNGQPGCTTVCPTGAVIFGKREGLLQRAKERLQRNPAKYFEKRVYGEKEAGGTQVLYLSHVPFEKIGLPKLENTGSIASYASVVHSFFYKFLWFPILVYWLISRKVRANWKHHQVEMEEYEKRTGLRAQL